MELAKKVWTFLEGKKTYIGIALGAIYQILITSGVVESETVIWTAILTWTGVSFRMAK